MPAIISMTGTLYACNHDKNEDQIWMQSQFHWELNMLAFAIIEWTISACNLKLKTDYLCLQSFEIGTKYACNHRTFIFARFVHKS